MREGAVGVLAAVCLGAGGGVPKRVVDEVLVAPDGLAGDHHAGAVRWSRKARRRVPNDRPVSLVAIEALDFLNAALGIALRPGDLAENLAVEGLGDLSALAPGDLLLVEGRATRVLLRVTAQNLPCSLLLPYHRGIVAAACRDEDGRRANRRGVVASVARIDGDGRLRAGDRVTIVPPEAVDAPGEMPRKPL